MTGIHLGFTGSRESITGSNYDAGTDEVGMYLGNEEWKAAFWDYSSMYPNCYWLRFSPALELLRWQSI